MMMVRTLSFFVPLNFMLSVNERLMPTLFASKSMSDQRTARISPHLHPVYAAKKIAG